MSGYVLNFIVYAMAMSGLICFALFIYKKIMNGGFHSSNSKQLAIEEIMNINPRKSLMIVKAGNERFLIASDIDKTTLIAKLEQENSSIETIANTEILDKISGKSAVQQSKSAYNYQNQKTKTWHPELVKNNQNVSKQNTRRNYNSLQMSDTMKEMAKKINEL